jgi:hypothetical protein
LYLGANGSQAKRLDLEIVSTVFNLTKAPAYTFSCTIPAADLHCRRRSSGGGLQIMRIRLQSALAGFRNAGGVARLAPVLALSAIALSGCAAVQGMPVPITTDSVSKAMVCPTNEEVLGFQYGTDAGAKQRNAVIAKCVSAINANYTQFKLKLQSEAVSANLTTDILALGLTGAAALTKGATATEFAQGSIVVQGTGDAISKDVFYQQTLPAIISTMEANRDAALKTIVDHETGDLTAQKYGLAEAVPDLSAFEAAGNLYKAISDLTKTANTTAQQAQDQLTDSQNAAYCAVAVSAPIQARLVAATAQVRKLSPTTDQAKLNSIADVFSVPHPAGTAFTTERGAVIGAILERVHGCAVTQDTAMADIESKLAAFK